MCLVPKIRHGKIEKLVKWCKVWGWRRSGSYICPNCYDVCREAMARPEECQDKKH